MKCERNLGLAFECLIIKRSYKSHGMKIEKVLLYWNYTPFLRVVKNLDKNLKQYFIVLLYYYFILFSKLSVKQIT